MLNQVPHQFSAMGLSVLTGWWSHCAFRTWKF